MADAHIAIWNQPCQVIANYYNVHLMKIFRGGGPSRHFPGLRVNRPGRSTIGPPGVNSHQPPLALALVWG